MTEKLTWFKSSYSDDSGGAYLEVAHEPDRTHIRDTKTPDRARLTVDPTTWQNFLAWAKPTS